MITRSFWICAAAFALPWLASASNIAIGTPNLFGSGLSPTFGTLVNFDSLTPFSTVSSNAFAAEGVSSITNDPSTNDLIVEPFSEQSPPNYLTTTDPNGAGDIDFTFTNLTNEVGIGIAEDGTTQTTLTVFGATGNVLGSFVETVPSSTFNAYYVITDPTADIKSFSINATQNLAVDDLQFVPTPEPAGISLAAVGAALLAGFIRRRKQV